MARATSGKDERWLWYTPRTADCLPLDPEAYPSTVYDGEVVPWPEWACKAPDGGIHVDARIAAIDVHLSRAPRGRDELTWTCDFQVLLATRNWLSQIEDLIDGQRVALGQVFVGGQILPDWATINESRATRLFSSGGWSKVCPICGSIFSVLRGKVFFSDPRVQGRPLIIASNEIMVREDEAIRRGLRTPIGAFKPSLVGLKRGGREPA